MQNIPTRVPTSQTCMYQGTFQIVKRNAWVLCAVTEKKVMILTREKTKYYSSTKHTISLGGLAHKFCRLEGLASWGVVAADADFWNSLLPEFLFETGCPMWHAGLTWTLTLVCTTCWYILIFICALHERRAEKGISFLEFCKCSRI